MARIKKYFLLGLTICFCRFILPGQISVIDSLNTILKKGKEDTNKVKIYYDLTWEYIYANEYQKGLQTAQQSVSLATKLNYKKGIALSVNDMGIIYSKLGNYPQALNCFFKSLKIKESLGDKKGASATYNNLGLVYGNQHDFPKALEYYFRALKIMTELGNLGAKANALNNIANIYRLQGDYQNALLYHLQSFDIKEKLEDKRGMASSLNNIGTIYAETKDYDKALEYYFKSLSLIEETGDKNGILSCLIDIGGTYAKIGKYKLGLDYAQKGFKMAEELQLLESEKYAHQTLSFIYEKLNQHAKALDHYKSYIVIRDSLFNEENTKKLVRQEMNFDFDKKQQKQELEQEKKDAVTTAKKKQQQLVIYSVSGALLFMFFLATVIFKSLQTNKLKNKIITQQKAEVEIQKALVEEKNKIVEEKNKDITDSITYAKRIQHAKLPKKEDIYASFPQCFVLFKPKDIVSGDFYFFHKNNNQSIFIAAADCTGHGVPGAFMSLIGSEKLEEAVSLSANPSEILKQLNKGIKTSLRQSDSNESTRDGMDIAFCSVDNDNRIVKYAGANRPLWLIRKGQAEVEETKATKQAIGGLTEDEHHFDTHELQLQQGDTFYICTDGYADQFSGQNGKKLMTKKFKEILIEIQHKTMQEQELHLDNFIENWKTGTEQVDDILVIGIRL
jgi:serine phosphatase RsbU (regulator of sigma subunit)